MQKINKSIVGNNNTNNVIVGGDYIKTEKVVQKTEVIHNSDYHISDAQAKEIRDRVQKIAESRSRESKFSYGSAYNALYDKYKITGYKLLPKDKFNDAIKWLDKQIAIYRPKLKKVDEEQWRKDMYKSLNARASQIHINVHEFASQVLELKQPITSLKELNDTRLKKLYSKLFSKKV